MWNINMKFSESVFTHLLSNLRAGFTSYNDNDIDQISSVIICFLHRLHLWPGLPPFKISTCLQPLVALINSEYEVRHRLLTISFLSKVLLPNTPDLFVLQDIFQYQQQFKISYFYLYLIWNHLNRKISSMQMCVGIWKKW